MAAGIVFAGYWSDAASAQRVLSWGCAATVGIGFLFGPSLASGSWPVVALGLSASLFVMGLVYGPLGMWLPGLFPVRVRYKIGRAHVCTPDTNAQIVCRLLLEKKKKND